MKSQEEPKTNLTDEELTQIGIDYILGILRSASTDVIDPKKWWERAKTALETGAAAAATFPQMVSKTANKLQIGAPTESTSNVISSISLRLTDQKDFERFRYICQRDSIYIIALARIQRDEQKRNKVGGEI